MMSENFLYNRLIQEFKQHPIMTREDLQKFFRQYEPELNEATFAWRIFDLKRQHLIGNLKRGVYTIRDKAVFEPSLNKSVLTISKLINKQYDANAYDIWDTIWLNEFTELQATSSLIVLEVERGQMERVFFLLKDKGFTEVFIKPDESMVERHVSEARHPIIIKPMISRSPVRLLRQVMVPTLEKILVDLYCDDQVYFAFRRHQLATIYRHAASRYALNFSRLFTYAKRRSRKDEIKNLLVKVLNKDLKEIIE